MRLRTYDDVAMAADVSIDDVKKAIEEGYLVRGLVTAYADDRDMILNSWHCKWFIKYRGDTSKYNKWKGDYGTAKTINNWRVCIMRYRQSWVGIAVHPVDKDRYYTFMNWDRQKAWDMAKAFALQDNRFISTSGHIDNRGLSMHVSLTYKEMAAIKDAFHGSFAHASLLKKLDYNMELSIKKKKEYVSKKGKKK